jgi:anti-anti-sigma factor
MTKVGETFLNAAQLTISTSSTEKGPVVSAVGEVDLTTVGTLRDPVISAVTSTDTPAVVVDLTKVDFIDSAGLALLVEARKLMAPDSRTLYVLLTKGRQPERVLKLGRFDTIMQLSYSMSEVV